MASMSADADVDDNQASRIEKDEDFEIEQLERRLKEARARQEARNGAKALKSRTSLLVSPSPSAPLSSKPHHFLLLLSDSALPLGSFAFSSGLESYLLHTRPSTPSALQFPTFLPLSLSAHASTTLPFVLAAHRDPALLLDLDDVLDASIPCTVARRASVAQGRALLGIWERAFCSAVPESAATKALKEFSGFLRAPIPEDGVPPASAHLPPLFGAICSLLGLSVQQTAYIYMLSHVKALLSAAVRASLFGPYQAQKMLASSEVQQGIECVIEREWETPWEDAGQTAPVVDLWMGRHELLYSRIFNS